jgi:hypothetical protein
MTRWDDKDFDVDEKSVEEIHLLKKFQDYLNLEKNEVEKRKWSGEHSQYPKIQKNQNLSLALFEGISEYTIESEKF